MRLLRHLLALTFVVLGAAYAGRAEAQATTIVTFVTVESVALMNGGAGAAGGIRFEGVTLGNTVPTPLALLRGSSLAESVVLSCERMALLSMTRPGAFQIHVEAQGINLVACRLVRVP